MKTAFYILIALTGLFASCHRPTGNGHLQESHPDSVGISCGQAQMAGTEGHEIADDTLSFAAPICVVDGKNYVFASDEYNTTYYIFSETGTLVSDPTLRVLPCEGSEVKHYVSVAGKSILADFSDDRSLRQLALLGRTLPGFKTYRKDTLAAFGRKVLYSVTVDIPAETSPHTNEIEEWLSRKITESLETESEQPRHAVKSVKKRHKNESITQHIDRIARNNARLYFASVRNEYGEIYDSYPAALFSILNLHARVQTDKFVTFQQYTNDYNGGMHGYFTEQLISFDLVHCKEIDYDYLFKDNSEDAIVALLIEAAGKDPKGQKELTGIENIRSTDERDNFLRTYGLSQPGLTEDGVVFSYQPYEISGFTDGTFHFTIPYEKLTPYLTDKAKWYLKDKK